MSNRSGGGREESGTVFPPDIPPTFPPAWFRRPAGGKAAPGDPFAVVVPLFRTRLFRRIAAWASAFAAMLVLVAAALFVRESQSSHFQARWFSRLASAVWSAPAPGPSQAIRFPDKGPFDERRGYTRIPAFTASLRERGFRVESQSRFSPRMLELADKGINPAYAEKTQAGLDLLDNRGHSMFKVAYPLRIYPHFDSIPPQIVNTLLFIENRSLLDSTWPERNPAVEWGRLAKAATELAARKLGKQGSVAGGSTLATQLEKYKHSEEGRTTAAGDKWLQMFSASLRAYREGTRTLEARRGIVREYVNTVPLAALPGHGEVNGLYDGMLAWYGVQLDSVNRLLRAPPSRGPGPGGVDSGADLAAVGNGYRQVLNLFIAHRRPTSYLLQHRDALQSISDNYLQVLGREGVISPQLRDAALRARPGLMRRAAPFLPPAFVDRKHVNSVRTELLQMLGLPRLYDLDRLDLTVGTTLDGRAQKSVVDVLKRLAEPAFLDSAGLRGFRLLDRGDPAKVVYSFTLYETVAGRNLLRVQADNYDQPLNINEGIKLDLGSTAKLRTLVHFLEILAGLRAELLGKEASVLRDLASSGPDPLTRWAAGYLASEGDRGSAPAGPSVTTASAAPRPGGEALAPIRTPDSPQIDSGLLAMMDAALERRFSGSPSERFFTGGGIHTFVNFEPGENGIMTVKEAFRHSVNLVFIRMMREIVQYHTARLPVSRAALLDSGAAGQRQIYLEKFAEQEGQVFLGRFFRKYRGSDPERITETFFHGVRPLPRRLAAAYLYLDPEADSASFFRFMRAQLRDTAYSAKTLSLLYRQRAQGIPGLADVGYLAGVHPLELWLVGYLRAHPDAGWSRVKEASRGQIRETYEWLFKTRHKAAQDSRIRGIMEVEAFLEIHRAWQRLGYPFGSLVPSYATAIGSSADRPNALAELVGILLNDGVKYPSVMIERLRFAEGTPYETVFGPADPPAERLLAPEICRALLPCLRDIVEHGTAVRGYKAFPLPGGKYIPLGGKTGTGDQRFETYGKGGQLLESRAVNRTATFAFFLGDRFFGTLTAHVHGKEADRYGFTSSLPVAILKLMAPGLMPMLSPREASGPPPGFAPSDRGVPRIRAAVPGPYSMRPVPDAAAIAKMLLGPAVPDTTQARPPNTWE